MEFREYFSLTKTTGFRGVIPWTADVPPSFYVVAGPSMIGTRIDPTNYTATFAEYHPVFDAVGIYWLGLSPNSPGLMALNTQGTYDRANPQYPLKHALTDGVFLKVTLQDGAVVATPAPSVILPADPSAALQAAKGAFASTLSSLIGMTPSELEQAMAGPTTGSATYTFTPDISGTYLFSGVAQVNGTATLPQTFTSPQSAWGGSMPPATIACASKPSGSTVTAATLVSSTLPGGGVMAAWRAALSAGAHAVASPDANVAELIVDGGWSQ